MKNCNYCSAPLDEDSQFCTNCGKQIEPQGKTCPQCGAEVENDSAFCSKCGTKLGQQVVPLETISKEVITPTASQEAEEIVYEWEEEKRRNLLYLICGCAFIALLALSWYGYSQFYKYTHVDVHELLEDLQLPKEYFHSAKEIVNKENFDLQTYQQGKEYTLRGWIVYNKKYGNEIRFNNITFKSDDKSLEDFYWVIGHILDCWNTTPGEASYGIDNDGNYFGTWASTFYYTSNKSKGIQFVMINDYDENGNLVFQSVDGKYEAAFHQVVL